MNLVGVACGRLDAFYEIGFGGCWDVAAGMSEVCGSLTCQQHIFLLALTAWKCWHVEMCLP